MRTLLAIALMAAAAAAHAENITLTDSYCQYTRVCVTVANDAGHEISISANPAYSAVHVYVDGVPYDAPFGNSTTITGLTLTNPDTGAQIVMSCTFEGTRKLTTGKGAHWVTSWRLTSGMLQR